MKKNDLIDLGFTLEVVTPEESGCDFTFEYLVYEIGDYSSLITCSSDMCNDGDYYVEFLDDTSIGKTFSIEVVKDLLNVINKFTKD